MALSLIVIRDFIPFNFSTICSYIYKYFEFVYYHHCWRIYNCITSLHTPVCLSVILWQGWFSKNQLLQFEAVKITWDCQSISPYLMYSDSFSVIFSRFPFFFLYSFCSYISLFLIYTSPLYLILFLVATWFELLYLHTCYSKEPLFYVKLPASQPLQPSTILSSN